MKPLLWLSLWTLAASWAHGESLYAPLLCPVDKAVLIAENTSAESQRFWFYEPNSQPFLEAGVDIPAHQSRVLTIPDYYNSDSTAVAIKTFTADFQFQLFCKDRPQAQKLASLASPWKSLQVPWTVMGPRRLTLHVLNLAPAKNALEIRAVKAWGSSQVVDARTLPNVFKDQTLTLTLDPDVQGLQVRAAGRVHVKAFDDQGREVPVQEEVSQTNLAPTKTRYFLFQSQGDATSEAFVVPMSDAKLIQESLDQIARPDTARLLVAQIESNLNFINRDFSSPSKTPWSWQVKEAQNYADFAHISCDGTPSLVEERMLEWLTSVGPTICFWNYRIVRELTLKEISQSPGSWPLGPRSLPHTH